MPPPHEFHDETDPASLPNFGPADEWVSAWLEPSASQPVDMNTQTLPGQFPESDKFRVADLLWIQALLEQALNPQLASQEFRIRRAMRAIAESDATVAARVSQSLPAIPRSPFQPRRRLRTAWITAMIVVMGFGFWFQATNPSRQARAAVEFIRRVAAQPTDREYQVIFTLTPTPNQNEPATPRKITGDLFVRGGEAFAFRTPAVIGTGSIWMGGNSDGVWLKPAIGPMVFEGQPERVMKRWLKRPIDAQFLQIAAVMKRLEENYVLEMRPDEIPPRGDLSKVGACRRLHGTCRMLNGSLPKTIDVWSSPDGGNVVRLELNWESDSQPGQMQMEFNYVKQSERPSDWYRSEGHITGNHSP